MLKTNTQQHCKEKKISAFPNCALGRRGAGRAPAEPRGPGRARGRAYVDVAALAGEAGAAHTLVSVLRVLARAPVLAWVWLTLVDVDLTAGKEEWIRIVIYILVP